MRTYHMLTLLELSNLVLTILTSLRLEIQDLEKLNLFKAKEDLSSII